jgi:hypothetical protein
MDVDLRAGIVRILKPDGTTAGTGFIVSDDGLAITCAHLLQASGAGRPDSVNLVLHITGDQLEATIEPEGWRPADAEDVAVLRLAQVLPAGVQPLLMARARGSKGHRFDVFGFPAANPEGGLWGDGEIMGETTIRGAPVLQLRSEEVTSGFSGAPVWDSTLQRVVGMVTAIAPPDRYGRLAATAFATPVDALVEVLPEVLNVLLVEAEEEFLRESIQLQKREEQLRQIAERRTPKPDPIAILRQATKLFAGELAKALTGKPCKKLRQLCLTRASKLPHARYLDMELLNDAVAHLGQLEREARILLAAWALEPVPGLIEALQRRAQVIGDYLRRIYQMEEIDPFDLQKGAASRRRQTDELDDPS